MVRRSALSEDRPGCFLYQALLSLRKPNATLCGALYQDTITRAVPKCLWLGCTRSLPKIPVVFVMLRRRSWNLVRLSLSSNSKAPHWCISVRLILFFQPNLVLSPDISRNDIARDNEVSGNLRFQSNHHKAVPEIWPSYRLVLLVHDPLANYPPKQSGVCILLSRL